MKPLFLLFLLLCSAAYTQTVVIPDAAFKNKLLSATTENNVAKDQNGTAIGIDVNGDSEIQLSEAQTVYALDVINAGINSLTGIEAFINLTSLKCDQNNLSVLELAALTALQDLTCSFNNLTELDLSENPNLEFLWTLNNPLTFVNVKNGSAFNLAEIDSGTWMEMWANLPDGCYVCADTFEIADIDEFLNTFGSGKHVSSYCTATPGGDYNTITGQLFVDVDNNGTCDGTESPQPYIRIDITDGTETGASFTDSNGTYRFYTQAGSFTLTPYFENMAFFTVTPVSAAASFPQVNNSVEQVDFCITPAGVHPDLEVVVAPLLPARPGFQATYKIVYRNKGNQVMSQTSGVNFYYQDQFVDFVSATETPDNQSPGVVSWDFTNLLPFEERSIELTLQVNTPTDPDFPVNIDDVLVYGAVVQPETGDEYPNDNTYTLHQTVVGAFDPNDILCLEGDSETPDQIGEQLHYRIRFENTGNFPAQNVVIAMELDEQQYEAASTLMLNASHEMEARLTGNVAEFFFQDIVLDSGGHGNILLAVKTLDNLQEGDTVMNKADIYFDYNAPVGTNTANTTFEATMSTQDPKRSAGVRIYPNPAAETLNISSLARISSIEWFDVSGRLLRLHITDAYETRMDISKQAAGVYYIKINTPQGSVVKKVVKE